MSEIKVGCFQIGIEIMKTGLFVVLDDIGCCLIMFHVVVTGKQFVTMSSSKKQDGDERFLRVQKDPRFWEMPEREHKVKIDKRFKSMFSDKRFKVKYTVDKRGRPINHTSAEDLRRFYNVSDTDSEEEEEEEEEEETRKKNQVTEKKVKKRGAEQPERGARLLQAGEMTLMLLFLLFLYIVKLQRRNVENELLSLVSVRR